MLGNYRTVFRVPGTAAFCAASFVMRSAIALYPLGLVLLISLRSQHYTFAGVLSSVYVVAAGAGNPILGRFVDRYGQTRLLLPLSAVHFVSMIILAVLAQIKAPDWTLLFPAAVGGFFYLAVGSLVRARWSFVLKSQRDLTTAYSLESTLDELIFVVGPLVATVIATQLNPALVMILGAVVVAIGALWLTRLPTTAPPAHAVGAPRTQSVLRFRGMPTLIVAMVAVGGFFASAEITMIAYCGQRGSAGISGAVLACFALGSASSGFLYGARHWATPILSRYRGQSAVFGVLPFLFLLTPNIPVLAGIAYVVGSATAPTLITAMGLVERIVPNRALTEGISWMTTGLGIGYGLIAAIAGRIADTHGARAAFSVAIACGLIEATTAFVLYRGLSGSPLPGDLADDESASPVDATAG